jgi:uncharacterized membrane protein YgcG
MGVTILGLLIFLLDAAVWYLFGPLPGFITVCVCWVAAMIWLRGRGGGGFGGGGDDGNDGGDGDSGGGGAD